MRIIGKPRLYAPILFLVFFLPLLAREYYMIRREAIDDALFHGKEMTTIVRKELSLHGDIVRLLDSISEPGVREKIDATVNARLGFFHVDSIKIYDSKGNVLYNGRGAPNGVKGSGDEKFLEALSGTPGAEIIDKDEYVREYGAATDRDFVEVYVPLADKGENARYVLETYFDYTPYAERNRVRLVFSTLTLAAVIGSAVGLLVFVEEKWRKLDKKVSDLTLLPICAYCKSIRVSPRDEMPEEWQRMETYFGYKNNVDFSHGICGDCMRKHFPDMADDIEDAKKGKIV